MLICILCAVGGLVIGAVLAGLVLRKETQLLLRENHDLRCRIRRIVREGAVERDKLQTQVELAEQRYRMEHNLNRSKNAAGANSTAKDG